jgi:hypothetical protein
MAAGELVGGHGAQRRQRRRGSDPGGGQQQFEELAVAVALKAVEHDGVGAHAGVDEELDGSSIVKRSDVATCTS